MDDKNPWNGYGKPSFTNYNIAQGRGGKGEKLRQIVLIVLRILSSIVGVTHGASITFLLNKLLASGTLTRFAIKNFSINIIIDYCY